MTDNVLEFIVQMRDEASQAWQKLTQAINTHADAHTKAAKSIEGGNSALNKAVEVYKAYSSVVSTASGGITGMVGAIAAGVVTGNIFTDVLEKTVEILNDMVAATTNQERAQKNLDTAFQVTGSKIGMSMEDLQEYLEKTSNAFLVNKTQLTDAASTIVLLGKATQDNFKPAMDLALRWTEVMGGDVASAAHTVARALSEPQLALSLLQRRGVEVTQAERDHINVLIETGNKAEAVSEALKLLTDGLGGPDSPSAHAGLSGAIDNVKNSWHELMLSFQDSSIQKAITSSLNGTSDLMKILTYIRNSKSWEEARIKISNDKTLGATGKEWQVDNPEAYRQSVMNDLSTQIGDHAKTLAMLQGSGQYSTAVDPQTQNFLDPTLRTLQNELTALQQKYDDLAAGAKKAGESLDGSNGLDGAAKKASDGLSKIGPLVADALRSVGLVYQAPQGPSNDGTGAPLAGSVVTAAEAKNSEALAKARQNLRQNHRDFAAATDINEQNRLRAEGAQLVAEITALERQSVTVSKEKTAQEQASNDAAKIGLSLSKQQELAARQAAEADAKKRGLNADPSKGDTTAFNKDVAVQMKAFYAQQSLEQANAAAATSREVAQQLKLAAAYGTSAAAANKLAAEQEAANNAADGKGNTNARDIQSQKFAQALAENAKAVRQQIDDLDVAAQKAAAAADPIAAAYMDALAPVIQKLKELRAAALNDGSPEAAAQQQAITAQEAKAKQAALDTAFKAQITNMNATLATGKQQLAQDEARIKYATAISKEQDYQNRLVQINLGLKKALALATTDEERAAAQKSADDERAQARQLADSADNVRKATGPMAQYISSAKDSWSDYQTAEVNAVNGTNAALADALMGTKNFGASMHDVLMQVVRDFEQVAIKSQITGPLADWAFGSKGSSSGGDSGMVGRALSWLGTKAMSFLPSFSGGGIMTANGAIPLRKYDGGGIASTPQLALFGEGSSPEAYVPVPNGRIPVEMKQSGGGGMAVNTTINISMPSGNGNGGGGNSGANNRQLATEIGAAVKAAFNDNLREQLRPGNILNQAGNFDPRVSM
jgi:hypothetical protein